MRLSSDYPAHTSPRLNPTVSSQLSHRTIREYTCDPVETEILETLYDVACWTPSSTGQQRASIIRVTDPAIKGQLAEVCGQEYLARLPEFWIFLADSRRNALIAQEQGVSTEAAGDMDKFFQGFTDACLAAQNVACACEALGLGTVFIGSIHNNSGKICEILDLDPLLFPALGLGFGYPNQSPQQKPRMPYRLRIFENHYKEEESYADALKAYDEEMTTYYDLRNANQRVDSFTCQVTKQIAPVPPRQLILQHIFEQGFTDQTSEPASEHPSDK